MTEPRRRNISDVLPDIESATRADLLASGLTRRAITESVRSGVLIRARRDRYLSASAPAMVVQAVRIGGRLSCLSLLRLLGVFVFATDRVHVHLVRSASRLRSATSRTRPLEKRTDRRARLHWRPLLRPEAGTTACVGVVDALIQAIYCQSPRHAIATLDSALNKGLIDMVDLAEVFAALPRRFAALRSFIDGRAQSGPETLVRLMALSLGCRVELQARLDGVGNVDLLLDGWLVVECDSKAFHSSWKQQLNDRRRDLGVAALGLATLRLTAEDVLYRPEKVFAGLEALVRSRRPVA